MKLFIYGCFYDFSPVLQTFHLPEFAVIVSTCVCVVLSAMCRKIMYCDPQGVAHVVIQSFQLSSCTLCNAPVQDVTETHLCVF